MSYNHKKLLAEIPDETYAAKFLQKVGIIHSECLCCGVEYYPNFSNKFISVFKNIQFTQKIFIFKQGKRKARLTI